MLCSCQGQKSDVQKKLTMSFESVQDQAEVLSRYYEKSIESTGEEKLKNEALFFGSLSQFFW